MRGFKDREELFKLRIAERILDSFHTCDRECLQKGVQCFPFGASVSESTISEVVQYIEPSTNMKYMAFDDFCELTCVSI